MIEPEIILAKLLRSANVPHALLFTGLDEGRKTNAAFNFIKGLLTERAMPFDFLHVTDSPVPIERIRDLKSAFAKSPLAGAHKAALIADAGSFRADAANSFLKLLEEPAGQALFILMAHARSSVLPTIVSRTLEVRFPVTGRIGQKTAGDDETFNIFIGDNLTDKLRAAQKYSLKNKSELLSILDVWLMKLRSKLCLGEDINVCFIKKILQLKKIIVSTNANPQLQLEELFVSSL